MAANKLDDISVAIGRLSANVENLSVDLSESRKTQDREHQENKKKLESIVSDVADLKRSVTVMQPIVDGYQVTRWKIAGAISLASALLIGLGFFVLKIGEAMFAWLLSHIR